MRTPVVDFIRDYREKNTVCFHMPGHKGNPVLGVEQWDITEVAGADSLYEADGIIAESESNAAALFGAQKTFYSTEGSSQCIRAMLYLAQVNRGPERANTILAARNVHKAFVYAAALLDFEVQWLWPQESSSVCSCPVTPEQLEQTLRAMPQPPAAVYVTSPDYLGQMADLQGLAAVCHRYGTILAVDNAHGAYLHFLGKPLHPLDLGADLCCDSAHKTLPVLTGGAYLHISKRLPACWCEKGKMALALFGSTSPSYLTLASLDACNRYLSEDYPTRLPRFVARLDALKARLCSAGWSIPKSEPLKLTIRGFVGCGGQELAEHLRRRGMECEYADRDFLVLMLTPENDVHLERLEDALKELSPRFCAPVDLPLPVTEQVVSTRKAVFAPAETISVEQAEGRVCAAPLVACPPAIPIVVSGERITREAIELFRYYRIQMVEVLREDCCG